MIFSWSCIIEVSGLKSFGLECEIGEQNANRWVSNEAYKRNIKSLPLSQSWLRQIYKIRIPANIKMK